MINTRKIKLIATALLMGVCIMNINAQQLKVPAPSPLQTIDQAFALSNIKIEYSRPSAKGRVVFGDVVPFGKIWRTGANASTKITFGEDVKIEGNDLAAGTYALYTLPNKDQWEIMFYKDLSLGGSVADYKIENEVLKIKVKPAAVASKTETFTINVANLTSNSATIELLWEQTRIAFNVKADIDAKIIKNIEAAVEKDNRPYYQAASYYYENDKELPKALEYINKAGEQNPKAYWVAHLKAKIQVKLKDNQGAIASAEKSLQLATEAKDDAYIKMNEKLIAEVKKSK